ncbi:hypothetical protein HK097_000695 [Rhizophlyctis rosea]|uniref:ACT domain-containing protein n=1 Tax=Rhizophlyctis rosea TaxID=64517 RepID=A0AAD5SHC2_9FUNG|nr:hypothetical protein HK097_000695 [Rhizophlyctis rosea]
MFASRLIRCRRAPTTLLPALHRAYHPSRLPTIDQAVTTILASSPTPSLAPPTRHILNCLVKNEPGVLSNVSGILAGRGFNIDSLVVAKTDIPELSRVTVVLNGDKNSVEQARKQVEDLVPVWAVLDYTHARVLERELLLVKVSTNGGVGVSEEPEEHILLENESLSEPTHAHAAFNPLMTSSLQRQSITELARLFGARIVDVSHESVIVELSAKSTRVDAFLKLLRPFGILEAARSGTMAMPRSLVDGLTDEQAVESDVEAVDATLLPPG